MKVDGLTQTTELREIYLMIQSFMDLAKDNSPSQLIYQLIRTKTEIYKKISNDDSIENFIERSILNNIIDTAVDYEKINSNMGIKEFLEFMDELKKFDVETKRDDADDDSVQVSTIHKSKGLEFKTVFIIDVATSKIPLRYTEKPFYVPRELAKGVFPASEPKEEFLQRRAQSAVCGHDQNH